VEGLAVSSVEVAGVVTDRDGHPLPDARVYFVAGPAQLPDIATLTGPDGRFSLSAPAPGIYTVGVTCDRAAGPVSRTVTADLCVAVRSSLDIRMDTG
jgi:carboxypeptidase family protein